MTFVDQAVILLRPHLFLDADPLANIHNIRAQSLVMARGVIIDTDALPRQRIFYTGPGKSGK